MLNIHRRSKSVFRTIVAQMAIDRSNAQRKRFIACRFSFHLVSATVCARSHRLRAPHRRRGGVGGGGVLVWGVFLLVGHMKGAMCVGRDMQPNVKMQYAQAAGMQCRERRDMLGRPFSSRAYPLCLRSPSDGSMLGKGIHEQQASSIYGITVTDLHIHELPYPYHSSTRRAVAPHLRLLTGRPTKSCGGAHRNKKKAETACSAVCRSSDDTESLDPTPI